MPLLVFPRPGVFACLVGLGATTSAQLVTEMGGGLGLQGVQFAYADSLGNDLYLAGQFAYANDLPTSPGIQLWNGNGLQAIGCGVEWDCVTPGSQAGLANPNWALATWNGDLYFGGYIFFNRDGYTYNGIMRWDGSQWLPLGNGVDGPVKSIKVIDDQLIVAGWFTYADTVLANGLARWDGTEWHRVLDVPVFSAGDINYVNDVVKYQDEWYLGGNLLSPARDLVKWNGTAWETVGGGFLGVFSQVNKLRVYDDRLYVAGSFSRCPEHAGVPSNPGSGIVAWDGIAWDDLGGGTCGSPNGSVLSMTWWNDELYACGLFTTMGGQSGARLAKWDGERWCMMTPPDYWGGGGPGALEVYNDSLYIGGSFLVAGGDSLSCFVKWVGGDYTYSCGALSTTEVHNSSDHILSCFPNPVSGELFLEVPGWVKGDCELRILDQLGKTVSIMRYAVDSRIDVSSLPAGGYVILLRDAAGQLANGRFVRD